MSRGRRGRPRRAGSGFVPLLAGCAVGWVALRPSLGAVSVSLLCLSAVTLWLLVLKPTRCNYKVRDLDRGCLYRVHGLARGCPQYHAQLKRDAVFEFLGLRNPGLRFRRVWQAAPPPRPEVPPTPPPTRSAAARRQAMYNGSMWVFSAVSAVAGVVMPLAVR